VVRHKTATTPIVSARHNQVELLEPPVALDAEPKTDAGKRTVTGARAQVDWTISVSMISGTPARRWRLRRRQLRRI
jgi:hypothetical protein